MKIKLLRDLPVDPEEGCTGGRIMEVIRGSEGTGRRLDRVMWWVKGDKGSEVGVLGREAVVIKEET